MDGGGVRGHLDQDFVLRVADPTGIATRNNITTGKRFL